MRMRDSWNDACRQANDLSLSMDFALRRVGIRPIRAAAYVSGNAIPDERTVRKVCCYLSHISKKRKRLFLDK